MFAYNGALEPFYPLIDLKYIRVLLQRKKDCHCSPIVKSMLEDDISCIDFEII